MIEFDKNYTTIVFCCKFLTAEKHKATKEIKEGDIFIEKADI